MRYYAVGEYGEQFLRPHYHVIVFNLHNVVANMLDQYWNNAKTGQSLGFIKYGTVTPASIHYVTKYVISRHEDKQEGRLRPFAVMSRNPGLGATYLTTHTKWHKDGLRNFANVNGVKTRLPRYYKDKMFTSALLEKIAQTSIEGADDAYRAEILRIGKTAADPFDVYDQRVRYAHDHINQEKK